VFFNFEVAPKTDVKQVHSFIPMRNV